ncbi:hypothetical protein [uncultured Sulfitobacter sp.]|uniref:hypothetical protein n=1 Tax=uncultured Sulfitobacter sp. TaxID=191468 RepID=UPI002604EAA4|nr:hypothetical protein [uncultured Sulfitobacter sp.]
MSGTKLGQVQIAVSGFFLSGTSRVFDAAQKFPIANRDTLTKSPGFLDIFAAAISNLYVFQLSCRGLIG